MRWALLASLILLAVSLYRVCEDQSRYVDLKTFTARLMLKQMVTANDLQKCTNKSYLKTNGGADGADETYIFR